MFCPVFHLGCTRRLVPCMQTQTYLDMYGARGGKADATTAPPVQHHFTHHAESSAGDGAAWPTRGAGSAGRVQALVSRQPRRSNRIHPLHPWAGDSDPTEVS